MSVSIVVVTYCSTRGAPREIAQYCELVARRTNGVEWIFVDNSPDGGDAEAVGAAIPTGAATFLRLPHNPGFAAGCNAGAAIASGQWLVLLNPDLFVTESILEQLLRCLDQAPAGSALAFSQLTHGHLHCGIGLTWYQWFIDRPAGRPLSLLGPSGGAAAFDRAAFLACGGFDTFLESWGEDADLAFRLRHAEVPVAEVDLGIPHLGRHSVTTSEVANRRAYLLIRNRFLVARRHYSRPRLLVACLTWPFVLSLLAFRHARRGTVLPFLRGIRDGLRTHHASDRGNRDGS